MTAPGSPAWFAAVERFCVAAGARVRHARGSALIVIGANGHLVPIHATASDRNWERQVRRKLARAGINLPTRI